MKVLLLAAGTGSRLRPITQTLPKCLVPIAGRPLLEFWLELLGPLASCGETIINTHYMPEKVREYVAQSPYREKISLVHETALLGTGGTLIQNLPRLKGEDTLVAHADNSGVSGHNYTIFSLVVTNVSELVSSQKLAFNDTDVHWYTTSEQRRELADPLIVVLTSLNQQGIRFVSQETPLQKP